jgi:hypothetical protein
MIRAREIGWLALAILGLAGAYTHFEVKKIAPAGWDELLGCSETVSFDGKKHLSLDEDSNAEISDDSTAARPVIRGRWLLIDPEKHVYRLDVSDGAAGEFIVVSPDDAEGCLLASGPLNAVDIRRSWFSWDPHDVDTQ